MIWIERKYINLLSPYLRNFKWKKPNLGNCSCPVCGDSETNKFKARFYFMERSNRYHVFCHNCGYSRNFVSFLKDTNPQLHEEYVKESVLEKIGENPQQKQRVRDTKVTAPAIEGSISDLICVAGLPSSHIAKAYVKSRLIPTPEHHRLFYTPEFMGWTNTQIPGKFIFTKDEPRLIIPMLTREGDLFAFQGRSLDPANKLRYITITLNYDYPKLFGLEQVDLSKKFYVLEGPIDSLFVKNSIAMAGSDVEDNSFIDDNAVFVMDNQPRNRDVIKKYRKLINKGHKLVVWPSEIEYKDVNDMVMSGISPEHVQKIIDENTVQGLEALLRVNEWKRIDV